MKLQYKKWKKEESQKCNVPEAPIVYEYKL